MSYELRDYQKNVFDKIINRLKKGDRKILVSAPTGFGKTALAYVISENAIKKNNRVLFTNHRIALAKQTYNKFADLNPNFIQGNNTDLSNYKLLTVATLQTLLNTEIQPPKIVIIDEVHYAYESDLVQQLFKRFPNSFFIGLSATPVDNKDNLLEGWDSIIDDYQTEDLIKLGALVPVKCFAPVSIDTSAVRKSNDDYNKTDLLEVINKPNINQTIIDNYIKLGENRKFILFAVNKQHCKDIKKQFADNGINTEIIDANTTESKREQYISQLKDNSIQGLISIEILTAGFDEPTVSLVIMATKTMQWKKYIQCVGRGLRLIGQNIKESILNGKKDCYLLDFCGNIEEHGLPTERKIFTFGKKISRVIDKKLELNTIAEHNDPKNILSEEKKLFLKNIGSVLDLYDGKIYTKESDLQDDVNKFLNKTGYFWWRQNSGKAFMSGRWVHFASKNGLPDNSVFYKDTSFFFGLELKLKNGRLTKHQKETLPEMIQKNVIFFIIESVYDVYLSIQHIEENIEIINGDVLIKKSIYELPQKQIEYRKKLRLI